MNDAELHPSQGQLRQAQQPEAGEWCSVVGADAFRHAVLAHRGVADGVDPCEIHTRYCLATNQKPAVRTSDREWIATIPVAS
jgi:hypothetical protein